MNGIFRLSWALSACSDVHRVLSNTMIVVTLPISFLYSDFECFWACRVHRQQARLKPKKRSSGASGPVQEPAKKRKRLKVLCNDDTHSPAKEKKSQKLKTTTHKPKSSSVTSNQMLSSPAGSGVVPALPSSNGTALNCSEVGVPLSDGHQRVVCNGQSVTLDKQLHVSSTGGPWYAFRSVHV